MSETENQVDVFEQQYRDIETNSKPAFSKGKDSHIKQSLKKVKKLVAESGNDIFETSLLIFGLHLISSDEDLPKDKKVQRLNSLLKKTAFKYEHVPLSGKNGDKFVVNMDNIANFAEDVENLNSNFRSSLGNSYKSIHQNFQRLLGGVRGEEQNPVKEALAKITNPNLKAETIFANIAEIPTLRSTIIDGVSFNQVLSHESEEDFLRFFYQATIDSRPQAGSFRTLLAKSLFAISREGKGKSDEYYKFQNLVKKFATNFFRDVIFNQDEAKTGQMVNFLNSYGSTFAQGLSYFYKHNYENILADTHLTSSTEQETTIHHHVNQSAQIGQILKHRAVQHNSKHLELLANEVSAIKFWNGENNGQLWKDAILGPQYHSLVFPPSKELLLQNRQELKEKIAQRKQELPQNIYFEQKDRTFELDRFAQSGNSITIIFKNGNGQNEALIEIKNNNVSLSCAIDPQLNVTIPEAFKSAYPTVSSLMENQILASYLMLLRKAKIADVAQPPVQTQKEAKKTKDANHKTDTVPIEEAEKDEDKKEYSITPSDKFNKELKSCSFVTRFRIRKALASIASGNKQIQFTEAQHTAGELYTRVGKYRIFLTRVPGGYIIESIKRRTKAYRKNK